MRKIRAENLRAYLDTRRGAAREIAKKLDIEPPTVSQWKSGKRPVPEEHIEKICEILGVSVNDLCNPINPFAAEWADQPAVQTLLQLVPKLSADGLHQLLLMALRLTQADKSLDKPNSSAP